MIADRRRGVGDAEPGMGAVAALAAGGDVEIDAGQVRFDGKRKVRTLSGGVEIRREAIHETADGKRFLVTHGDEFDGVVHDQLVAKGRPVVGEAD